MERRLGHETKITHVGDVTRFNREERPKYTKCRQSITEILDNGKEDPSEFFKERYNSKEDKGYTHQTLVLLEKIEQDIPNIYQEVGLSRSE